MSENMKIWNAVKRPPEAALKKISGGRLSGMTDIKPMWRYEAMTELFGPCGDGWRFEIEEVWTEDGNDGQVMAFAKINLWFRKNPTTETAQIWSEPVPGIGGSMLVTKESAGLHTSDEGYKMAVTDALSVAMKVIGVGADIYSGQWDGSKYKTAAEPTKPEKTGTWGDKLTNTTTADDLRKVYKEMPTDQREAWAVEVAGRRKELGV